MAKPFFHYGDRVTVTAGAFAGLRGVVIDPRRDKDVNEELSEGEFRDIAEGRFCVVKLLILGHYFAVHLEPSSLKHATTRP